MTAEELQYNKMTKTNVKKLVVTLGIPTIISMLITSIYNLADTFFVSQLGESASGAVTVVFPLMAIIQAIGFTFGMGSGSIISSKLGEKKDDEAQINGSSAFYVAISIGVILSLFCLLFIKPLLKLLGSTETVLPYAIDYGKYIIFGFPIMIGSFVMNNILRAEGKARFSMIGLTAGGILNIALDPLFIYVFNMGTSGAAVATIISQSVSFLILLSMFLFHKSIIRLSIRKITKDLSVYFEIIKVGFPSMCRQGLASISTVLLNNAAKTYGGDAALSAIGIVQKVFTVIFSVSLGIGQGYQPVCGYNYFAKKYSRVKEAMLFTLFVGIVLMSIFSITFFIIAEDLLKTFIDSEKAVDIGTTALRLQCVAMPFQSLNVICNMTFQSTKQKLNATILSCCRQGIFFIPCILLLPLLFKIDGVILSQPLADIITFIFTIPFFITMIKRINQLIKMESEQLNAELI